MYKQSYHDKYSNRRFVKHKRQNTKNNHQHHPQYCDKVYMLYPKGRQYWLWFRLDEDGEPCARLYSEFPCAYSKMTMETTGDYQTVYTKSHPWLTLGNGTLVKGVVRRHHTVPIFTISEVIWLKGEYVFTSCAFSTLLARMKSMIGQLDISIVAKVNHRHHVKCVQLSMPFTISHQMKTMSDEGRRSLVEYLDGLPYEVYQVLVYSMTATVKQSTRMSLEELRKMFVPKELRRERFTMTLLEEHDSYRLVNDKVDTVFVVSDIKMSRKLNRWMNATYGIECLDDIEESDAEDEPRSSIQVECVFDKKWIPVKCIEMS